MANLKDLGVEFNKIRDNGGRIGEENAASWPAAFQKFFPVFGSVFKEVDAEAALKNGRAAKGLSFLYVMTSILSGSDIEFRNSAKGTANALKLDPHNLSNTWMHGIEGNQNFCFTIYFETKDVDGTVKEGYDADYIEHLQTASPREAENRLQEGVLQINGKLNPKKIKYVGFRYNSGSGFIFRYYKIN